MEATLLVMDVTDRSAVG
nr:hypothetical protein [Sicyoidochytrium minutum DNA virus]